MFHLDAVQGTHSLTITGHEVLCHCLLNRCCDRMDNFARKIKNVNLIIMFRYFLYYYSLLCTQYMEVERNFQYEVRSQIYKRNMGQSEFLKTLGQI